MSSYFMGSVTNSKSSQWASTQIARSMVWSDFGLSCFDYPLDRKNRDTVCTLLTDLPFKIIAVWVVSRPINGNSKSNFEHWCVKVQAPPALISIDFLESKRKGAFGLQQTTATDAELEDFLHYYVRTDHGNRTREKWRIISSVTPSPLKNTSYLKYIDDYDFNKLKAFMKNKNNKHKLSDVALVKDINIKRKVCDIADFLGMWTESQHQQKKSNKKTASEKTYSPITGNCQQFAADLFHFLVGHNYAKKVEDVKLKVQSPFDKKLYNVKKIEAERSKTNDVYDDDEKHIIEEEDQNMENIKKKPSLDSKYKHMNNPQSDLIVDSLSE